MLQRWNGNEIIVDTHTKTDSGEENYPLLLPGMEPATFGSWRSSTLPVSLMWLTILVQAKRHTKATLMKWALKFISVTLFRWPWPSVWVSVAPQRCTVQGHAHRLHGSGCGSAERGHQLGAQQSWFAPHYLVRLEPFRSADFRILSAAP